MQINYAAKSLQSCPTLCDPIPGMAPLSLGFSRQEHWSGLPFPSPMHESESEVAQSCLTLSDPMDCSLPGFSSCARLSATPWTAAHQAPLSMRFSRQGYWSGLLFSPPGDLSNPGIEPRSPALQADSLPTELQGKPLGPPKGQFSDIREEGHLEGLEWALTASSGTFNPVFSPVCHPTLGAIW